MLNLLYSTLLPLPLPQSKRTIIVEGFDWKVVVIGYACGLIIGLVIGYFATSRRTNWFVRNLECTYAGDDEDK